MLPIIKMKSFKVEGISKTIGNEEQKPIKRVKKRTSPFKLKDTRIDIY